MDNIQLRCRAHNGYEAELDFGPRNIPAVREERASYLNDATTATHENGLSRQPSGLLRTHKDDHVSDIVWLSEASERDARSDLRLLLFRDPTRLYSTRRNDVDRHAKWGEFLDYSSQGRSCWPNTTPHRGNRELPPC